MESIPVSKFRASLKEYLDRMAVGEVINVNGLEICKVGGKSEVVQDVVQADVQIDYEKLAKLIIEGIKDVQGYVQVDVQVDDKKAKLRELQGMYDYRKMEGSTNFQASENNFKPEEYVEVDAYSLGDDSVSWGERWIKMRKSDLPKNFSISNVRPVQAEKDLPMHNLGVAIRPQAKMNDGSNPVLKPVKKKKK